MTSPSVRRELENFTRVIQEALGGRAFNTRKLPYRFAGKTYWAFEADGPEGHLHFTFCESGTTRLPVGALGSFADSVDAHYVLEFIRREAEGSDCV